MATIEHGTHSAYVHRKCRCEPCREAEKAYQADYRQRNRERLLEYDRRPERDTRLRDDPEKRRARQIAKDKLVKRRGRKPCQECSTPNAQMHHEDYTRPLDVTWLCSSCHGKAHRKPNTARMCGLL